ncbi:MAG: preprotein translocase subunit SecE [Candidatus Kapaibacterium sp.]|nr:preprotein translocase subunit SecE [Ignavibacteriota bacterium]MCB9221180.1 preprotein translocase subunit SecE [Ignavibacteria bacterium]
MIAKIKKITEEVTAEMKKVAWPSREHLWKSSQIVVVVTVIITLIVSVFDWIISNGVDVLFSSF